MDRAETNQLVNKEKIIEKLKKSIIEKNPHSTNYKHL